MTTKEEILAGLSTLANEYTDIAIVWHVIILIVLAALFAGWKPGNTLMILMLSSLLMSVSVFAGIDNNLFTAAIFAFLVIVSIYASLRSGNGTIKGDRSWPDIAGLLMIIFGLVYPEFLKTDSIIEYVYATPTGLIPCPTLAVLTGFTLLYKGFGSVTWSLTIILSGLFYGLLGVFYLGIYMDWFLVVGSVVLLMNTYFLRRVSFTKE